MTTEPGHFRRGIAWTTVLTVTLLHVSPKNVAAEEPPPTEEAEAVEEPAASSEEALAEGQGAGTVPDLITATGGVPAEAADANTAIETVRDSMTRVVEHAETGIGDTYLIEFGDTFDWVQMISGEWIKGEIERMRSDTLEFDSDKLGMQNLDFADVSLVHSPRVNTYVFDDRISATGRAVITGELVIVETDEGTKTFPRSELESIIEGERERDWWSMKLRFGLTLNRGNTDQVTYDIMFNTRREDRLTLVNLNYQGTFGKTDGAQNVNRHLGEFLFNVFLGSRWWVTPAFGQLFSDRFQNIKFRATPAAGAGVHIIDASKVTWDFVTGLGYQYLNYRDASLLTSGSNPQNDGFIPLFTYADFDITGDIDLTLSWLTNLVFTTIGNTNHTGKANLAVELIEVLDLDIAFTYLRTERPGPPPDATAPPIEQNDYILVVGISLELG